MSIKPVVVLVLLLTACQVYPSLIPERTPQRLADKDAASARHWTRHNEGDLTLRVVVPDGWETYNTSAGIVLNEFIGSGTPDTPLAGFLIHIFVPATGTFRLPLDDDMNMAWYALKQVVHNKEFVGEALVSEPVAFEWDGHDAAYYLLNNRDRTVTMLLALGMADRQALVVCHISVPEDQAGRIRPLLPELLESLTVDGHAIDAAALHDLPDPLVFPAE
jgi:hypothetical protein